MGPDTASEWQRQARRWCCWRRCALAADRPDRGCQRASARFADAGAIVVFDGVCVPCNGWVDVLLRHDRHGQFRFAAMQSPAGPRLLAGHGLDPDNPASFLLFDAQGARTDSEAIPCLLLQLGDP